MKKILSILAAVIVAAMFYASCGISYRETVPARIVPTHLRTDLMEYDLGDLREGNALIESQSPRFSWVVPSIGNNTKQTAYRILVDDITATDSIVRATYGDYPYRCVCWVVRAWDSGWIKSSQSVAVPYEGPRLKPDNKYSWQVQLRLESKTGINKVMKETSLCQTAAFKTASELKEYATPSYPILAKEEAGKLIPGGIYDFEKAAFGKLRLTLKADSEDSVTVIIGERLKDGRIEHTPRVSSVVYDEIGLRLKPGENTYIVEPNRDGRNTGPMAVPTQDYVGVVAPFRYCTIEGVSPAGGPSGAAPGGDIAVVKAKRISYHYPFDMEAASFRCSNDTLNAIWDLCHYSLEPCSFLGIWVDGNRERIPYEYDALIAQLCHYGSDAEYSIDRRTLEWLLEKPTWPTEWILYTVEMAWNDYLWTGDDRALKANYDLLKAHGLDALRQSNGLVSTRKGQSQEFLESIRRGTITDIVDWPHNGIEDDGFVYTDYNAVVNALYYRTLLRLSDIAGVLEATRVIPSAVEGSHPLPAAPGYREDARRFAIEAEATRQAFEKAFFSPQTGIYKDGIDTDHCSLHTNMMAILCSLVPEERVAAVADFIQTRGLNCSIFGAHNLLEALYAADRGDYALQLMLRDDLRSWYNGLRLGTTITLEAWDDSFKPNQDWNHIAGAAPGNAIPFGLMGIRPLEPGFAKVQIRPQPGSLKWAQITVPTIRGAISVDIRGGKMTVTIPANMTADIYLPDAGHTFAGSVGSGSYTFSY